MAFFSLKNHIIKNLSTEKKGKREALNTVNYIRSSKKIQKTKKCAKAREKMKSLLPLKVKICDNSGLS